MSHVFVEEIVLDFDATDNTIYGHQENRHYHGYYKAHCYLPLHVFCGDHLLVSLLRPSNMDSAKYAGAVLKLLVHHLRQVWPKVTIIFRFIYKVCIEIRLKQRSIRDCKRM